jgi:endonuclease/exonuclease/phosphatase family metal-dependent hydrolase
LDDCDSSYAPRSVHSVGNPDPAVGTADLVVASFNVHSGVDGWGRRFDVTGALASLDADVIILQESWTPDVGTGIADEASKQLGYESHELETAKGRLSGPHPSPGRKWKPPSGRFDGPRVILPDDSRAAAKIKTSTTSPTWPSNRRWPHGTGTEKGTWNVALLSRLPVVSTGVIDLGQLRYDSSQRGALRVDVKTRAGTVAVFGTHMSHLSRGSPLQIWQLRKELAEVELPAVLGGDMNLWGPPLVAQLPGWHRAVIGRSWPAWRPHSQPDHILVREPCRVVSAQVMPACGSDHLPVRAAIAIS